jgi:hypothetical protein
MPPQEIIDGPSPFLLETLETCIGSYEDLYDEANCLNLNIFMPTQGLAGTSSGSEDLTINTKNLPVLVWVYGGAFRRGGNGVCLFGKTSQPLTLYTTKTPHPTLYLTSLSGPYD